MQRLNAYFVLRLVFSFRAADLEIPANAGSTSNNTVHRIMLAR